MRYQVKSILWTLGVTLALCLLDGHFYPPINPPPIPTQESSSAISIRLAEIPPMIYREIK